MANSIRLSPKHGLNPSLDICCWCGESKSIVLMGKLPNDAMAAHKICMDYEPCDACAKKWAECVIVMEVTNRKPSDNRMPMKSSDGMDCYPTLRIVGISEDAANRIGIKLKKGERCMMEDTAFEKLFGEALKQRGDA